MSRYLKRFIVIGLGNFGFSLCQKLAQLGHEVIAVDLDEYAIDRIGKLISRAAVADGTDVEVLRKLGVDSADAAVVSTGDDITSSILAVMALHDLKIREIYSKVISMDHARVMEKIGITQTIFPERDTALALAARISGRALLKYFALGKNFSVQEMGIPESWTGQSIGDLHVRQTHNVTIIAIHDILTDQFFDTPGPDYRLKESDTLFVAGANSALAKIATLE